MDLTERALTPLAAIPRPFLRWAGSKRLVLHKLVAHLPRSWNAYYEPFLGGGSLFFLLRPKTAVLSDSCAELISTYQALRDNPAAVLRYLRPMQLSRERYYAVRNNRSGGRFKRAAEFIFLNKGCWNGLYRVNSRGKFNVPYGLPKSPFFYDEENVRACSEQLRLPGVRLLSGDFELALQGAGDGDLVFLDPPYVTGHRNNGFVDYNETLFSWSDQARLAQVARQLQRRGCQVVVTNADHDSVLGLYSTFSVSRFDRKSTIAASSAKRGRTTELVLVG